MYFALKRNIGLFLSLSFIFVMFLEIAFVPQWGFAARQINPSNLMAAEDLEPLLDVYQQIVQQSKQKMLEAKHTEVPAKQTASMPAKLADIWPRILQHAKAKGNLEPVYLMRGFEFLQSLASKGDKSARATISKARADIKARFLHVDVNLWSDRQNAYALLTFVLNGGNENIFALLLDSGVALPIPNSIIDGVQAYLDNNKADFNAAFADIANYASAPGDFQASINLHMANYYKNSDNLKAIERLNAARLLAKGSFFEEVAIRNEIYIAAKYGDATLVRILARAYLANFSKSPYIRSFWHKYISAVFLLQDKVDANGMENLLDSVPVRLQNFIYLTIIYQKIIKGDLSAAKDFALKAIAIEDSHDYDTNRSLLYYAISLIHSSKLHESKRILDHLDIGKLSAKDKALLYISQQAIKKILAAPQLQTTASSNVDVLDKSKAVVEPAFKEKPADIGKLNKQNEALPKIIDSSSKILNTIDEMLKNDNAKNID